MPNSHWQPNFSSMIWCRQAQCLPISQEHVVTEPSETLHNIYKWPKAYLLHGTHFRKQNSIFIIMYTQISTVHIGLHIWEPVFDWENEGKAEEEAEVIPFTQSEGKPAVEMSRVKEAKERDGSRSRRSTPRKDSWGWHCWNQCQPSEGKFQGNDDSRLLTEETSASTGVAELWGRREVVFLIYWFFFSAPRIVPGVFKALNKH